MRGVRGNLKSGCVSSRSLCFLLSVAACGGKSATELQERRGSHGEDAAAVRSDAGTPSPLSPDRDGPDASVGDDGPEVPPGEATPNEPEGSTPDGVAEPSSEPDEPGPVETATPDEPPVPNTPRTARCGALAPLAADPERVAEMLARSLWDEPPDAALLDARESGALATAEGLEAEVRRLLAHPRAATRLAAFGRWWLGPGWTDSYELAKDPAVFPEFEPALRDAIERENHLFLESLLLDEGSTLATLLGADYTLANQALAELYDVDVQGEEFSRVQLDPAHRSGLLTQPFFLALTTQNESDPIRRGFFVRERLLCTVLPAPPPTLIEVTEPAPSAEEQTTRTLYETSLSNPACLACHQLGTWIGFGFEHYDALGRYRETERGQPVDSTAQVVLGTETLEFSNAPEMLRALSVRPEVERCFAQQWLTFLFGRYPDDAVGEFVGHELEPGSCPLGSGSPVPCIEPVTVQSRAHEALECAVGGDGLNLRELTVALVTTDLFANAFQCGTERCLAELEYCYEAYSAGDAGGSGLLECRPLGPSEAGCDVALAASPGCSCDVTTGGPRVRCER